MTWRTTILDKEPSQNQTRRNPWKYLCHQRPQRCFSVNGKPLPICSRCLGFYLGVIIGIIICLLVPQFKETSFSVIVIAVGCAQIPFVVDGTLQYSFRWMSSNPRRVTTGILAGFGLGIAFGWLILNMG